MKKILLVKNNSYKWFDNGTFFFKGYFYYKKNNSATSERIFRGLEAVNEIVNSFNVNSPEKFLERIEGVFSIIYNDAITFACTDISRSFPIFYDFNYNMISDSAELIRDELKITCSNVDELAYLELFSNDSIFGKKTIYNEICQLDLAEYIIIKNDVCITKKYFYHFNNISNLTYDDYKKKFYTLSIKKFNIIKNIVNDAPLILSLSGGYDSRYVACMFKEVGIDNVICYTYGKKNSFEVSQSKKIADALGYKWLFIEHDDNIFRDFFDDIGTRYINFYTNHDSIPYLQNFFAVKELSEKKLIPKKSVFVTGLCNDLPTGAHYWKYKNIDEYSIDKTAEAIYDLFFQRYKISCIKKNGWIKYIKKYINDLPIKVYDKQSYYQVMDCVYTSGVHSHDYLNMNLVHEFFGYMWLIPCWDSELLSFWYSVPYCYKINQKLYEDFLMDKLFKKYGFADKKQFVSYSNNFIVRMIKYFIGGIINYLCLNFSIPFKRKYDINNFAPLELAIFKNIPNISNIHYNKAGLKYLLNTYFLQNKYGVENNIRFNKFVEKKYS